MNISCPNCDQRYRAAERDAGKPVTCNRCSQHFVIPPPLMPRPAAAAVPPPLPLVTVRNTAALQKSSSPADTAGLILLICLILATVTTVAILAGRSTLQETASAAAPQAKPPSTPEPEKKSGAATGEPNAEVASPENLITEEQPESGSTTPLLTVESEVDLLVPPSQPPSSDPADAFDPATIRIVSVRVGPLKIGGNALLGTTSSDPVLSIVLEITNNGPDEIHYESWSGEKLTLGGGNRASVRDSNGQSYQARYVSAGRFSPKPEGRTRAAVLAQGASVTDVLVFDPIEGTVEYLDLELPGRNIRKTSSKTYRILASEIARAE